jgi:hypothetical protein
VTIGETAALSLIRLTMPRASAKASLGVSHPFVAAYVVPAIQQRQNCRRESTWRWGKLMASPFIVWKEDALG